MKLLRKSFRVGLLGGLFSLALLCNSHIAQGVDWQKLGSDLLGAGAQQKPATVGELTNSEITDGLKEALRVGSARVVEQLGNLDGFNADPAIHIPLPSQLQTVRNALQPLGMAGMLDDLELKLNRAAEQATPPAKELFWGAINEMTIDDVQKIYNGPPDAATRYFEGKMSTPLAEAMQPIVDNSLAEVGAIQAYDAVMSEYKSIPFVPDVKADLNSYVVDKGIGGIFHYLAEEEAAIRKDPVARTTDLLQKVFGGK